MRTLTLWVFLQLVLSGAQQADSVAARGGRRAVAVERYRLWERLCEAQSALRARLCPRGDGHPEHGA
ncbi:MAG: hypothetical protein IPI67_13315 [Myxococcales bacterium]|nr:hypothetical protein [Myxococcales bacterium]